MSPISREHPTVKLLHVQTEGHKAVLGEATDGYTVRDESMKVSKIPNGYEYLSSDVHEGVIRRTDISAQTLHSNDARSRYFVYVPKNRLPGAFLDITMTAATYAAGTPSANRGILVEPHNPLYLSHLAWCSRYDLFMQLRGAAGCDKTKVMVGSHKHTCTMAAAVGLFAAQRDLPVTFARACLEGGSNFVREMGEISGKTKFFKDTDLGLALRYLANDMQAPNGADPTDLMTVGTDLVAYYIDRIDHHAAASDEDIKALHKKGFANASGQFVDALSTPFDCGVFKGMIFGGILKYIAKLSRLDEQAQKHVTVVVSGIVTGVAGASGPAPVAAAIVGAGVGSLGAIITNYLMRKRDLRGAGLKLVGAFLADQRREMRANPNPNAADDWREAKDGLELSLLCAGLR